MELYSLFRFLLGIFRLEQKAQDRERVIESLPRPLKGHAVMLRAVKDVVFASLCM